MTGAVAASGVFFFPAAPFFLLLHGKGATIPEGTGVTAYVNGDTPLKRENFTNRNTERVDTLTALLQVTSNPSGAEISIDESKSGSAPFSVRLAPGEHHVVVKKLGFSTWDKRISIFPGESFVDVELVPE